MSSEIDFDNPDPDFIPNCEGHGVYKGKCPHIGTRTVIDPDPNAAGAPVVFRLCQLCYELREQDKRIERSETR